MPMSRIGPVGSVFALIATAALALADGPACEPLELQRLVGSDTDAGDWFGQAVATDGQTLVVGAQKFDTEGAAYVFERAPGNPGRWVESARLAHEPVTEDDHFGQSVAVNGTTVLVGRPEAYGQLEPGSVLVFERDAGKRGAWGLVASFRADDGGPGDAFGESVGLDGDVAVVGAPDHDAAGSNHGAAYVFERSPGDPASWVQRDKLLPDDPGTRNFGSSVAVSGDTLIVGGPTSAAGRATIYRRFERDGVVSWNPVASHVAVNDFGSAVDLDGDLAVVSAPRQGVQNPCGWAPSAGVVSVFERNLGGPDAWGLATQLVAPDADGADLLGRSIALQGDTIVVGADLDQIGGVLQRGSAYVFRRDADGSWRHVVKLGPATYDGFDRFGYAVATDGEHVFAGGIWADDVGQSSGAVFVADIAGPDCNVNGVPDACDIGSGRSADLDGDGVPDECQTDCDDNGCPDILDIEEWTYRDCDGTLSLDTCDVVDGTSADVNGDTVPDTCETTDCNGNQTPDVADVVGGASPDCNANFMPDECEVTGGYAWDSGWLYAAIGSGQEVPWISANQFEAGDGGVIRAVAAAHHIQSGLAIGDPVTLFVWDDPNDDGQPDDAVLLRTVQRTIQTLSQPFADALFDIYTFEPVVVTESFFVGLETTAPFSMSHDDSYPVLRSRGWYAAGSATESFRDASPYGGANLLIRAIELDCNGNGVPDACDLADGALLDADGDGVPDRCQGDIDADGTIDADDLAFLIDAWGPCPDGPCAADLDANGVVGTSDLLILLKHWSG